MKYISKWMRDVLSTEDRIEIDNQSINPRHPTRLDLAIIGRLDVMTENPHQVAFNLVRKYREYANT